MAKHILIDSYFGLVRTAISQDGKLVDYYEESPEQGRTKGNIYKGVVKKVDAHIQAAFVRYGTGRDGFLPLRDVPMGRNAPVEGRNAPDRSEADGEDATGPLKHTLNGAVGPGDSVLVQVVKDEVGGKGAALTTKLSLSGRYLVYMPGKEGDGGISSRLSDEERSAMKKVMGELEIPPNGSIILRTAALNKPSIELQADLDRLVEAYREIQEQAHYRKDPGLVHREEPPALRYLREYYTPDVERIWVNQEDVLEQCRQFFNLYEPKAAAKVALSEDGPLMFQSLGLEAEVDRLTARKVVLPSGANFVIDQTEALVAIDVNSAKSRAEGASASRGDRGDRGDDRENGEEDRGDARRGRKELEDTVFAINMEAGAEIARQLRLRDLGGIIIVDFIDMEDERHRRKVEDAMRKALAADKAKVKVFEITPLGLLQISRQRLRKAGPHFSRTSCEICHGKGWHASPAVSALSVLRRLEEKCRSRRSAAPVTVTAPYPVANQLMNELRVHVLGLEERHDCAIRILADQSHSGEAVFSTAAAEGDAGKALPAKPREPRPETAKAGTGRRIRERVPRQAAQPPIENKQSVIEKKMIAVSEKVIVEKGSAEPGLPVRVPVRIVPAMQPGPADADEAMAEQPGKSAEAPPKPTGRRSRRGRGKKSGRQAEPAARDSRDVARDMKQGRSTPPQQGRTAPSRGQAAPGGRPVRSTAPQARPVASQARSPQATPQIRKAPEGQGSRPELQQEQASGRPKRRSRRRPRKGGAGPERPQPASI